jgi:hypothetical protein
LAAGYGNAFVDMSLLKWRFHGKRTSYTTRMVASRLIYLQKLLINHPDLTPAYATRFAMSFLGELVRNPSDEKRPIALAGAALVMRGSQLCVSTIENPAPWIISRKVSTVDPWLFS